MFGLKLRDFIRLTRPFFLLGGALFYIQGVVIAIVEGAPFNLGHFVVGQALVTSIQLMVQYSNEYYDREVDAAGKNRTWFSGGSGVLAKGTISPAAVRTAAQMWGAAGLALAAAAALLLPWAGVVGGLAFAAGWAYSAPPMRLMGRGWGELSASLVVAFLTPLTGLVLQAGTRPLPPVFFAACLPLVLIHTAMLVAFEFPDREGDQAFGKRTLVVRLGLQRAAWLHAGLLALAFGLSAGLAGAAGRFGLLALPLAAWQGFWAWKVAGRMVKGQEQKQGLHLLVTGALGLVGLTALLGLVGVIAAR